MKRLIAALSLLCAPALWAQKWEAGVGVGGAFYTSQTFTNGAASANASLANGFVASAWLGNNSSGRLGGELRYDYENTALKLSSGSASPSFGANTQAIHYDFLFHFTSQESTVRPFIAVGGGVKMYRGTGTESPSQPLQGIGLLTKTMDTTALISLGGGVKFNINHALQLRVELHDYLTPFPLKVIAPAAGTKTGGWLMDFVPMGALAVTF